MRLAGKHAVVTGGATGIGEALALGVARAGATVGVLDKNGAGAERTAEAIRAAGGRAVALTCDITRYDQVEAALAEVLRHFTPIHILVANAGGSQGQTRSFLDLTLAEWHEMVDRNLTGAFYCGQVFARHMAANGGGAIVFTSSQLSETARPGLVHYASAKGGVRQLVKGMAVDLARYEIRVNAIAPGPTLTPGNREMFERPEYREANLRTIPLGRIGRPEEMVGAVVYLASDEASFTTGTTIFVDGGYVIV